MRGSESRILTTHAGSLPRSEALTQVFIRQSRCEMVDATELAPLVAASTRRVIEQQRASGIDVGNDGEQSRESFFTYVRHRLTGFGGESDRPIMRDLVRYPTFVQLKMPEFSRPMVSLLRAPKAVGAVRHADPGAAARDVERYTALVAELFSRSVQKQPSRWASRPKVMRPDGAKNAALATADWLTRTSLPATFNTMGVSPAAGPQRVPEDTLKPLPTWTVSPIRFVPSANMTPLPRRKRPSGLLARQPCTRKSTSSRWSV